MEVLKNINKKHYLHLCRTGIIPKSLPSMCVLAVKPDKDGNPNRAKSRIIVLGNFEDRYYSKSQRYAPVIKYSSLRLMTYMAVGDKRVLQQGNCKNAFCQSILPEDECMVIRPPAGNPAYDKDEYLLLNKTVYGLRRSPHHWYNQFTSILRKLKLAPSPNDPCIYTGVINSDDPMSTRAPIHVGVYVDDSIFYSTEPAEEELFKAGLANEIKVDFVGDVDFFLDTAFTWIRQSNGHLSVHMTQTAFTKFSAHRFGVNAMNPVPNMTPYRSGMTIDSIPAPSPNDPDLKRRTKV